MTSPYARPAEPPEDSTPDATIPMVPDYGYNQPSQPPFTEETLVEPLAPGSRPGVQGERFGYFPTPGYGQPYQQPDYGQSTVPGQPASEHNPTYAPQSNYTQPSYGQPYQTGYTEPAGPADAISSRSGYQTYPGAQPSQFPVPTAPAPYGYQQALPEHPNATLVFVLGLIGLLLFQILSPVAWYLGAKGQREVRDNPGRWRSGGLLSAGKILGIIGTAIMALVGAFLFFILIALMASGA